MLNEIYNEVDIIVQSKIEEIINGVYNGLISNHNDFCGCNYCKIMEECLSLEKFSNGLLKSLEYQDTFHNFDDGYTLPNDVINYISLEKEIRILVEKKESLKREIMKSKY
jgi:hypothetical protein